MAKSKKTPTNGKDSRAGLRAVGGTAAGAAAGSLFGPIGAAVGAVVGGVAGLRAKELPKIKSVKASAKGVTKKLTIGKKSSRPGKSSKKR